MRLLALSEFAYNFLNSSFYSLPDEDVVDLQETLYEADWDLSSAKKLIASGALVANASGDEKEDEE